MSKPIALACLIATVPVLAQDCGVTDENETFEVLVGRDWQQQEFGSNSKDTTSGTTLSLGYKMYELAPGSFMATLTYRFAGAKNVPNAADTTHKHEYLAFGIDFHFDTKTNFTPTCGLEYRIGQNTYQLPGVPKFKYHDAQAWLKVGADYIFKPYSISEHRIWISGVYPCIGIEAAMPVTRSRNDGTIKGSVNVNGTDVAYSAPAVSNQWSGRIYLGVRF